MKYPYLFILLLFITASFALNSCSSDQSEEEITANLTSNKWVLHDVSFDVSSNDPEHAWVDKESTTLYFTSDNQGVMIFIQKDYDSLLGNNIRIEDIAFEYSVNGTTISLSTENGFAHTLTYKGSYLLEGELFYERVEMSYSDYELLRSLGPVSGSCGNGVYYSVNKKTATITIHGDGEMRDYTSANLVPWKEYTINYVVIEDGVQSIGDNAFGNMSIADVDFSSNNSLLRIGKGAFKNCLLSSVSLPESVRKVEDEAFADNRYLKRFYGIDNNSIQFIGSFIFQNCDLLSFGNLDFNSSLEEVKDYAFFGIPIKNLTFKEGVKSIGNSAFSDISNTELILPESLTEIGTTAFIGEFNKISIGKNLKQIGEKAFISTKSGSIYINQSTPPTTKTSVICEGSDWSSNESRWYLYVPVGSKTAYSSKSPWSKFKSIYTDSSLSEKGDGDDNGNNVGNNNWSEIKYYEIDGEKYNMIYVEGNKEIPSFWIMQTELPPTAAFKVGNALLRLNSNLDNAVIRAEFHSFIDELREKTGVPFRLPTRSEWQYAAKGGIYSKGYTYSGSNTLSDVGWYSGNSNGQPHGIALKAKNELGIYDMSGNYSELCNDGSDLYNVDGPYCGGSWKLSMSNCKVTSWNNGVTSGLVPGTNLKEKNAFDARHITIRLVYTAK